MTIAALLREVVEIVVVYMRKVKIQCSGLIKLIDKEINIVDL